MRRLDSLGIPYDVTPGVPAFAAAAAAMKQECTRATSRPLACATSISAMISSKVRDELSTRRASFGAPATSSIGTSDPA
ncbi:hypothetical protein ACP7H9_14250, partial [Idiomarina sp. ST20R2A10]|uniref:hypothetical protein n=1 Tax=Idiomarina sp. ST20R2A10 TaxID=3418369 RepID=UPI003EC5461B